MYDFDAENDNYAAAKSDAVANIILAALHLQDAATYHGAAGDMGKRALDAAAHVRRVIAEGK